MIYALLGLAWLGHLILMIGSHNWFYGQRFALHLGKVVHLCHALLVLAFPIVVLWLFAWDLAGLLAWPPATMEQGWCLAYLAICLFVALVWLPLDTWARNRRREPVEHRHSEMVDVARQLGRRPVGNGNQTFLAVLPGTEIFQVEYTQKTIRLPRLPSAWDGLTVLHLSDLHWHGTPDQDYFRVVLERCASWHPDVVAITGDIVDSQCHHEWMRPLLGLLRWRIACVAIMGNHDHRYDAELVRRELRGLGMHVPINDWLELKVRDESLVVVGHEGPWLSPEPDLRHCPADPFRLCLSHTPDNIGWARRHGIDLMLSGHVHGGQIRIPPFGSILLPSRHGRRYDQGTFVEPPTVLHVSRGLSGEHPVRFNCRPEVTLLTLRKQDERSR